MRNSFFYQVFVESHARWLWIILIFEYFVAINISPTILSDYPFLNSFVEWFAFIPVVHGFDDTAKHPEAVRFYIVMANLLLIPKAMSIYFTFVKSKIPFIMAYVITPYTKTKPLKSRKLFQNTFLGIETENSEIEQIPRSMFSRIVWSLMILLFGLTEIFLYNIGVNGYPPIQIRQLVLSAGFSLWWEFSVMTTVSALMLAISAFIIKDYIRLFTSICRYKSWGKPT